MFAVNCEEDTLLCNGKRKHFFIRESDTRTSTFVSS